MQHRDVPTDFGCLSLTAIDGAITALKWSASGRSDRSPVLDQAARELQEYMAHERQVFGVRIYIAGSDFQQAVCRAMQAIPFGETCTYGDIATRLGASAQAVGRACGNNPVPILVPCHRVMGAHGRLVGFSGDGGVETKVALLRHEGAGGFLI